MKVLLEIETEDGGTGGQVVLTVNGVSRHTSKFFTGYPEVTDMCATRTAIDFMRMLHTEAAERSVGNRPINMLRKLHNSVASELSYRMKNESELTRTMEFVKRTLDNSIDE